MKQLVAISLLALAATVACGTRIPAVDVRSPEVAGELVVADASPVLTDTHVAEPDVELTQQVADTPDMVAPDDSAADLPSELTAPDLAEAIDLVPLDLPCSEPEEMPVAGMLYRDMDESSASLYAQGFYPKFDEPIAGWDVMLLGKDNELKTTSCSAGTWHFEGVSPGRYVLDVARPKQADCTSNNLPRRFPKAIREGHVTIVTIGDSVPKVGPKPLFPERLAARVSALAEVTNLNLAVSGTTTQHWLPGGYYFEEILDPALPEADVVVISIGGNDVMGYLGGALNNPYEMLKKVEGLDAFTTEIHDSVALIINEIKARYEDVDVVFCLYVNYARSTYWSSMAGPYESLFISTGHNALVKARGLLADMNYVLIADMFGALGDADVDPYLIDSVHLSDAGHELYADQLFFALGGLTLDQQTTEVERLFGFAW